MGATTNQEQGVGGRRAHRDRGGLDECIVEGSSAIFWVAGGLDHSRLTRRLAIPGLEGHLDHELRMEVDEANVVVLVREVCIYLVRVVCRALDAPSLHRAARVNKQQYVLVSRLWDHRDARHAI